MSDTCRVSISPDAPDATAARAKATGRMSMSTRPDPERSGAVEIANLSVSLGRNRVIVTCYVLIGRNAGSLLGLESVGSLSAALPEGDG